MTKSSPTHTPIQRSRWSCRPGLTGGKQCSIEFWFAGGPPIAVIAVKFYKGTERTRKVKASHASLYQNSYRHRYRRWMVANSEPSGLGFRVTARPVEHTGTVQEAAQH